MLIIYFYYLGIACQPPTAPLNGRVIENSHYLAGDYVEFICFSGHVIVGEPVAICQDNGTWSTPPPLCKRYETMLDDIN